MLLAISLDEMIHWKGEGKGEDEGEGKLEESNVHTSMIY
jgi:hypothetical protein